MPPLQQTYDTDEEDAIAENAAAPELDAEPEERVNVAVPVLRVDCPACRASFIVKADFDAA